MRTWLMLLSFILIISEILVLSEEQKDEENFKEKIHSIYEEMYEELTFDKAKVKNEEKDSENVTHDIKNEESADDRIKTFPRKMLARRREEHLQLLKGIANNPKYEWRFQLVELGVAKVRYK